MKIGPIDPKPLPTTPAVERKSPPAGGGAGAAESAQVKISAAARLAADPVESSFDADKVARIAQAIQDGTFKPNAEAIADKLIANARELLAKTYR